MTLPLSREKRLAKPLLRRILVVALIAGPIIIVAFWLTFQHIPGWYQPLRLDEPGIQRARVSTTNLADFVGDQLVQGRAFDVVLADHLVNEWLAAFPHLWPEARQILGSDTTAAAVHFSEGSIRVGAHQIWGDFQAIVSLGLSLSVANDGRIVEVKLTGVRGGSLPLPKTILKPICLELLERIRASKPKADHPADRFASVFRSFESVDKLFDGVELHNRFIWPNGERPFRIDAVTVGTGELRVRIEPL